MKNRFENDRFYRDQYDEEMRHIAPSAPHGFAVILALALVLVFAAVACFSAILTFIGGL